METFAINAEVREDAGKGASRRLRRTGSVPGILYGAGKDPVNLSVVHSELLRHLDHEAFYSHILDLSVAGKVEQVVLKDLQRHPAKPHVLHIDFLRVSARQKLNLNIPLHFINEDTCPGKKIGGGVISHHLTEVEITCLPKDLPEFIAVDLGDMQLGDSLTLATLELPNGVGLTHEADTQLVVSVHKHHGIDELDHEDAEEGDEGQAEA